MPTVASRVLARYSRAKATATAATRAPGPGHACGSRSPGGFQKGNTCWKLSARQAGRLQDIASGKREAPAPKPGAGRGTPEARSKTAQRIRAKIDRIRSGKDVGFGGVGTLPTRGIGFDPKRFQFKLGHGAETGSVDSLHGVEEWNPHLAGVIQVWKDPADGKTYVVNGHNRLDKAKKLGVKHINVMHLDARDAQEARAMGALTNIAEGRGTPLDAAKFFRDTGINREDLKATGVPLRESVAVQGLALSALPSNVFDRVVSGEIPMARAAIIGGSGLDETQQKSLVELLDRKKGRNLTDGAVKALADLVRSSGKTAGRGGANLFGDDPEEESLALHRASLEDTIKRRLAGEQRLFGRVSKAKAAADLARGGNVIDVAKSGGIADAAAQTIAVFDRLKNLSGPVSRALNRASERIAGGENAGAVTDATYADLVRDLPEYLAHGDVFA